MKDKLYIGCVPHEEDCAQVGSANYRENAIKECKALIGQLRRLHGEPTTGVILKIEGQMHDFGTYYEVVAVYDDDNESQTEEAFKYEMLPERWDEQAKAELAS